MPLFPGNSGNVDREASASVPVPTVWRRWCGLLLISAYFCGIMTER